MANPDNIEDFQFALTYTAAQGDPTDPNVDWDTMSFMAGVGQAGLDQAQAMYETVAGQVARGENPGIRDPKVTYAAVVAWNVWEQPAAEVPPVDEAPTPQ